MFNHIPDDLKQFKSWVLWRSEDHGLPKPVKVPYSVHGHKASVTDPSTWSSFEQVIACPCVGYDKVFMADEPLVEASGIGFVISDADPFTFIDLDDTEGNAEAAARHTAIFSAFNSYSEMSPSGRGLHIIVRGKVAGAGRRRSKVEVYSRERYMTVTGHVYHQAPIAERQDLINSLYNEMGGIHTLSYEGSGEQVNTDREVYDRAASAANGDKFTRLWNGDWENFGYPSNSEADFALIDILAYYTQNREQIERLFRVSSLGQRSKYNKRHGSKLIDYMVGKSFDRQLPPLDLDGLTNQFKEVMDKAKASIQPEYTTISQPSPHASPYTRPPGLVGELADFFYRAAPRPVPEIALAAALALVAGMAGRGYNVSNTGLNIYLMLLAPTGSGKEAMQSGIDRIINAVKLTCPAASQFVGPAIIASGQALVKYLDSSPSFVSIQSDFGLVLKQMVSPNANAATQMLKKMYLDLYHKSGAGTTFRPMVYSDPDKNTKEIHSPAFTILGESPTDMFYANLTEELITDGLLPRFMFIEYNGARVPLNAHAAHAVPTEHLLQGFNGFANTCHIMLQTGKCIAVQTEPEALALLNTFNQHADDKINNTTKDVLRHLWNRAHLKALKVAAILAVGVNQYDPVITHELAVWATNFVAHDTNKLVAKFEVGEVGSPVSKQENDMLKVVGQFFTRPYDEVATYGVTRPMHADGIVPAVYITRRLASMASFRGDRMGASSAIDRTLRGLCDSGVLQECPRNQMSAKYGANAKAFICTDVAGLMNYNAAITAK